MSLIKCPECQKSISDKAEFCPHCGLPAEYFLAASATAAEPVKDNTPISSPQKATKNAPPKTSKKATRTKRAPSKQPATGSFLEDILIGEPDEHGWTRVIHEGKLYEKKTFYWDNCTATIYEPILFKTKTPYKNQQAPFTRNSHH